MYSSTSGPNTTFVLLPKHRQNTNNKKKEKEKEKEKQRVNILPKK